MDLDEIRDRLVRKLCEILKFSSQTEVAISYTCDPWYNRPILEENQTSIGKLLKVYLIDLPARHMFHSAQAYLPGVTVQANLKGTSNCIWLA